MSHRAQAGIAVVAAVLLAGGAFYWLRARSSAAPPAIAAEPAVSAPPEIPSEPRRESLPTEAPTKAETKKAAPDPAAGIPMRTGEVLDFSADVAKVSNVATLRLQTVEKRNFFGKNAWHMQAFAHTQSPLRMVFELDDQFDSYSDAGTMSSLQYEMHLSERGQKVDSVQRLTATGKEPAPDDATEARVLPGTRDPLGMMQYLRSVDWSKTREVRGPVYDGRKLYEVLATLEGASENVTVPAGNYTATKIALRVFDNGAEMKDAHFALYLAHNDARTPVLLEAELPFASARVGLKSSK
jgi:Protein of unknown function (DUF3108)